MDERQALLEAHGAFYRAFEACDLEAMERVWSRRPQDVCIHPGWDICTGWTAVRESWRRILGSGQQLKFEVPAVEAEVLDGVGRITAVENVFGPDGSFIGRVACTKLFVKIDGEWRLTLHHGSPVGLITGPDGEEEVFH